MRRLEGLHAVRARIAAGYAERLEHLDVLLPRADEGDVHGWQAYVIQVDDRDRVMQELRAQGIEVQIGTYALNLLGAYADQGDFPGATRVFECALALPFHTLLTDDELDRVAAALDTVVSRH
jgi:dTDP-4-amino-4,6-dideoxygalactose transaminase